MRPFFCFFLLLCFVRAFSQPQSNAQLVARTTFCDSALEYKYKPEYIFKGKKWWIKYNPVSLFFGGAMLFYQKNVSHQIGARCSHQLSCSNFSKVVIRRYGIAKGILLTADRLTRCNGLGISDLNRDVDFNSRGKAIDYPLLLTLRKKTI